MDTSMHLKKSCLPGSSHHRQRDGQTNAQIGPHERRSLCQEPASKEVKLTQPQFYNNIIVCNTFLKHDVHSVLNSNLFLNSLLK